MKISNKVPLIATSVILSAFALFGTFQYLEIKNSIIVQTESRVAETGSVLSAQVAQWLNERLKIVAGMSSAISANLSSDIDDANNVVLIKKLLGNPVYAPDARDYYLVLEEGDGKLINNRPVDLPPGWDGRTRPWYQLAVKYDKPMMTKTYIDSETGKLLVSASAPLKNKGKLTGVVASDIELSAISDAVNAVNFNNMGYAFLLNGSGEIISSPDKAINGKGISAFYTGTAPKLIPTLQESKVNSKPVLTGFYSLSGFAGSENNWLLGVVIDKEKAFAPANKFAITEIIAAAIAALLTSIVFFFFMKAALIKPVHLLTKQSDEISRGKLDSPIDGVDRKDEIGELAQAVQRMQKALGMAMSKLAASRKN